jgi:hypothetical protein
MFVALVVIAGCKQGKGDRCQVNADCASGLVCSAATMTCSGQTELGIDAAVPPQDAHKDGGASDAPHD